MLGPIDLPDDPKFNLAFWRGLAFGLCLGGAGWIIIGASVWAAFQSVWSGVR